MEQFEKRSPAQRRLSRQARPYAIQPQGAGWVLTCGALSDVIEKPTGRA